MTDKVVQAYRIVVEMDHGVMYFQEVLKTMPKQRDLQRIADEYNAVVYVEPVDYGFALVH